MTSVHSSVPVLFVMLALGYGVLILSQNQKRPLDVLGRIVGGIILIGSFLGLLCAAVSGLRCNKGGGAMGAGDCGMMKKAGCPISSMMGSGESAPATPPQ